MDPLIPTGAPAPNFCLPDVHSREFCLTQARGRILILNFWSLECPWCERSDHELLSGLQAWGERVQMWVIAANANEPAEHVAAEAARRDLPAPLTDSNQQVTGLYGAQTTPHLFVIDPGGLLRYQGALDDVTFRRRTPGVSYLRNAVDALLAGQGPDPAQTPPYGCTIVRNFD